MANIAVARAAVCTQLQSRRSEISEHRTPPESVRRIPQRQQHTASFANMYCSTYVLSTFQMCFEIHAVALSLKVFYILSPEAHISMQTGR
jgi:hypothetical protein